MRGSDRLDNPIPENPKSMKGWAYCRTMDQVRRWFGDPYLILSDEEIEDVLDNQIAPEIREEARQFLKRLSEKNRVRLSKVPKVIF